MLCKCLHRERKRADMKKPMELELDDVVRCIKTAYNFNGQRVTSGNIYRIIATQHRLGEEPQYKLIWQGVELVGYFRRSLFSDPLNREPYEHAED